MKFLWISDLADTLALAMRVQREGNDVEFCILDRSRAMCGDGGMITKVRDWRSALAKDKIIVFDMVGSGAIAASLTKAGYMVFGASPLMDKLELDRPFGTKVMQVSGIPVPPTLTFHDFDSAIRFLETKGGRYVFKPSENMNTAYTYVGYNDEDMIHFLNNAKTDSAMNKVVEFELQEFQDGVEVSLEGLFNGQS
jgi:phosphoribosylamine-glycine ligase